MDRRQFAAIATGIKSAYPASRALEDKASMDFWYMMLRDIPYDAAENAVMEHICTSTFPPSIAEIRKLCMERTEPRVPGPDEAWAGVQRAIARHGRDDPEGAYAEMGPLAAEVARGMGWTRLCLSECQAADRARFMDAYGARAEEERAERQLPGFVAEGKARLAWKYAAPRGAGRIAGAGAPGKGQEAGTDGRQG